MENTSPVNKRKGKTFNRGRHRGRIIYVPKNQPKIDTSNVEPQNLESMKEESIIKEENANRKTNRRMFNKPKFVKKTGGTKYGAFSKIQQKKFTNEEEDIKVEINKTNIEEKNSEFSEKLIKELSEGTYECMVCMGKIKRHVATWNCDYCYVVFHLYCIKKWFKQSHNANNIWYCPACRHEQTLAPKEYRCFCKKQKDPVDDPMITPHSCGNTCNKKRNETCPHPCTLPCHPGKCPDCTAFRTQSCYCGANQTMVRCSDNSTGFSCNNICGKLLSCGKCYCQQKCHPGPCPKCDKKFQQKCYCGKEISIRECTSGIEEGEEGDKRTYSCNQICGKILDCGNHTCNEICHPGPCKKCPFGVEDVTTCPCGKTPLTQLNHEKRKSCLDPIPTCSKICYKILPCGHKCLKKCHNGNCGYCMQMVKVYCRCKSTSKEVPCCLTNNFDKEDKLIQKLKKQYNYQIPFICDNICNSRMNCQRHRCTIKCCPDRGLGYLTENHTCVKICGKKLNCGIHSCELHCHSGQCPPCPIIIREKISCKCGKTSLDPPNPCGTKPPLCNFPCSIPRKCGHPANHTCHNDSQCPPCMVLVDKMCFGKHMIVKNVPCYMKRVSCGGPCSKILICGEHYCDRPCGHSGPCIDIKKKKLQPGEKISCQQQCKKPLECGHLCLEICHPGKPCPTGQCNQQVQIFCECKHLTKFMKCSEVKELLEKKNYEQKNISELPPLIECNSECRILARNKKLAEALDIDLIKKELPLYPKTLVDFALKNTSFIESIELAFEKLLNNPKAIIHSFQPMSKEKRVAIHELSDHYHLESQSVDKEPYKSVIVKKTTKSKLPSIRLSVLIKDESRMKLLEEKWKESIQQTPEPIPRKILLEIKEEEEKRKKEMEQIQKQLESEPIIESNVTGNELNSKKYIPPEKEIKVSKDSNIWNVLSEEYS